MYEPKEPASREGEHLAREPLDADQVIAWLRDSGAIEQTLQSALGGLPNERDTTLARMGDVLQATARGLEPQAAAMWAGVPEHVLQGWMEKDPAFAGALYGARALAAAHGVRPGVQHTPAMIRVVLVAMSNGSTRLEATRLAGFRDNRFRVLVGGSSTLDALLKAARRVRPPRGRGVGTYRPRLLGKKPASGGFRLVQRSTPEGEPD